MISWLQAKMIFDEDFIIWNISKYSITNPIRNYIFYLGGVFLF